jgi:hypothetical protein
VEVLLVDLIVSNSNDPDCARFEPICSGGVVLDGFSPVMHLPVDFESHTQVGAIEIDNEPVDHMLAAELETQRAPAPQDLPCSRFSPCGMAPKRPCPLEFVLRTVPSGHLSGPI